MNSAAKPNPSPQPPRVKQYIESENMRSEIFLLVNTKKTDTAIAVTDILCVMGGIKKFKGNGTNITNIDAARVKRNTLNDLPKSSSLRRLEITAIKTAVIKGKEPQ